MRTTTLILSFVLFIASISMANSGSRNDFHENFRTDIIGSWMCIEAEVIGTFNQGGTLVASGSSTSNSLWHGIWKRTGRHTFIVKVQSFKYDENGNAESIDTAEAVIKMVDNDNIEAVQDSELTYTCTRITLP